MIVDRLKSPRNSNDQPLSLPFEFSDAAKSALLTHTQAADGFADPDIIQRTARTVGTLAHFAPDTLSQRAYDAAAMQSLADDLTRPCRPKRYRAAGHGLLNYFVYPDDDRNQRSNAYVGTLLGDIPYIDTASDTYRRRLDDSTIATLEDDRSIPAADWTDLRIGANIPEIAKVSRVTNIEMQLARAAFTVDNVIHAADDDQELFKNILRTETFYAPLLEVYGFHAFDMMAQSSAGKVRALKSGNEKVLEHASATLDQAKQINVDEIMRHFFGRYPNRHLFQTDQEPINDEAIVFSSTSLAELSDGSHRGELHARFKSVGKYAMKLLRNPNYTLSDELRPADVFGMLAVLPDEKQLGAMFSDTISHALASRTIDLTASASKTHPIYIQGSPRFVEQVCRQLPNDIYQRYVQTKVIDGAPADHIYQVAKFNATLVADSQVLPVEFQFQTKKDRKNARLGVPSHMNHNAGDGISSIIPGTPQDLRTIFMRKHDIDPNGELVNPLSIPHGEELKVRFMKASSR